MNQIVNVLKALSDETRLRIINLLYERELCVCDVMVILQISQAKASRHLINLKNAGLLKYSIKNYHSLFISHFSNSLATAVKKLAPILPSTTL